MFKVAQVSTSIPHSNKMANKKVKLIADLKFQNTNSLSSNLWYSVIVDYYNLNFNFTRF